MIKQLFDYYLSHQNELVEKYNDKYLIITKDGVVSVWNREDDAAAYHDAKKRYGLGNFIMQLCTPGAEAYTYFNHHIAK